jgi:hypothetical protein
MRKITLLTLTTCLCLPMLVRADEAEEAKKILDKAIKAMGGADKLTKLPAVSWKGKGMVQVEGLKIDLTDEWSAQGDRLFRWRVEVTMDGQSESGVLVINKDKGWVKGDNSDKVRDMPKDDLRMLQNEFRVIRLVERLVPLKDKAYQLSPLGEIKIKDRAAVGIKVKHKDRPEVDLFFDKETSLPVRAELRVKERKDGPEVLHTYWFGEYKAVQGVKHFTKASLRRDDKPAIDLELTEIDLHEKLDDNTFDKP